ncbi:toprim domain-containing protein [Lottiidibacillus patelloidae]|uniref:toprim domain-containing protein n=1 Tax=Lottiidibacillus patelloidae TaxID=2670334 RepID=UPI0018E95E6A|nr:toprim domain-containing protein [Lottiidibacillus patelloidae]
MISHEEKVIVVEGKSDKKRLEKLINEPVKIICTNGTLSIDKLEELFDELEGKDVYILTDADDAGAKLRKQLLHEFPNAEHLYIDKMYREVATTPFEYLARLLLSANFLVNKTYYM